MEIINFYTIAALIVSVIFPGYAMWNGKKTKNMVLENPDLKISMFNQTAIILITLTVISLAPFVIYKESLAEIGLNFLDKPFWIIGLFIISFLSLYLLKSIKLTTKNAQKFLKSMESVQFLMPTTRREYKLTIFVSFVAGICEEIIYRGFLFWFLSNYMPIVPSLVLANVPFALGHLTTTGNKNTLSAFVLAFVFSGAFLLTKSLWLPILLHILVDLYAMTFAYKSHLLLNSKSHKTPENI